MSVSVERNSACLEVEAAKILVVDDSAAARAQYRRELVAAGMNVTEASNGQDALDRATVQEFQLVVTDVHMPTMGGLELIQKLRSLPNYSTVPILVLTSDYSRERLREGREVGASGWLIKPPQKNALVKTIRKALRPKP